MRKAERWLEKWSPTLGLVSLGTISVLLSMLPLLLLRDRTGILLTLCGAASWQLGRAWVLWREQIGEHFPIGPTSSSQGDSLRRQAMKHEASSPHVDLRPYGKVLSDKRGLN